jgi:hypothetical protein
MQHFFSESRFGIGTTETSLLQPIGRKLHKYPNPSSTPKPKRMKLVVLFFIAALGLIFCRDPPILPTSFEAKIDDHITIHKAHHDKIHMHACERLLYDLKTERVRFDLHAKVPGEKKINISMMCLHKEVWNFMLLTC